MSRFQLGLVLETIGRPLRPALQIASALGVSTIQVDAVGDLAPSRIGETGRREFRTLLRSHNLTLAALNCPVKRGIDSPDDQQPRLERIQQAMQLAFDLGARKIIVPLPKLPGETEVARTQLLKDALLALGGFGDRVGTFVGLEIGLDGGAAVRDYLTAFDRGSLGVTYDPANYLANGFDPLAELPALAGKVVHTQARDARRATVSGGATEVLVGAGDNDWMIYLATLEAIGFQGAICVDREGGTDKLADATAGVQFLRRFIPVATS